MSAPDKETRINQILRGCTKLHHEGYLPLNDGETLEVYLNGLREELGTSFPDMAGIFEHLDGGESKRLSCHDHSLEPDTHPTTSHRLPTVARRSRHPSGGHELGGRNVPTDVADVRGATAAARLPGLDLLLGANGLGLRKGLRDRLGKRLLLGSVSNAANRF